MKEVTQWYNKMLERVVRRDPDQYWWVHNGWKDDLPAKKREQEKKRLEAARVAAAVWRQIMPREQEPIAQKN